MKVVSTVAGRTRCGLPEPIFLAFFMTGLAGEICMSPVKSEARALRMVKLPQQPVVWIVAGAAFSTERTLVYVILLMAVSTVPGSLCELW